VQYCDGIAEERKDVQLLGVHGVVVSRVDSTLLDYK
jgi:hypothetical protein